MQLNQGEGSVGKGFCLYKARQPQFRAQNPPEVEGEK